MGRGSSTQRELGAAGILYGRLQPRIKSDVEVTSGGKLGKMDPMQQGFFRDPYFQDVHGFSGTDFWFVKTKRLPEGWFDQTDNLNGQLSSQNMLQRVFDAETDDYLQTGYQLAVLELDDSENPTNIDSRTYGEDVLFLDVETERKSIAVLLREAQAIEELSGGSGQWRYFDDLLKDNQPALVYYNPDKEEILGATWCLNDEETP